jgi:hypothetical protein
MSFYNIDGELYCETCALAPLETEDECEEMGMNAFISDSSDSVCHCGNCARIWDECDLTGEGFIPSLRSFLEGLVRVEEPAWKCLPSWPKHNRNTLIQDTGLSHYVGKGLYTETDTIRVWDYEEYNYLWDQATNHDLQEPEREMFYRIGELLLDAETCEGERLNTLVKALLSILPQEAR